MFNELERQARIPVEIAGPSGKLEARVTGASEEGPLYHQGLIAVVCHPHPLHGGTMDNKVVTTLARTYRDLGVVAITFNFRGVGQSSGEFDNARGEVDDLLAVTDWVLEQQPTTRFLLAGFSFGSSVAAQGCQRLQASQRTGVEHLTLVAPPVERYPYLEGKQVCSPLCVIQGGKDEVVEASGVYQWAGQLEGAVEIIRFEQAGHFFHGMLVELKRRLTEVMMKQLA